MSLRVLVARIVSLFQSARMDRDLEDEIRDHLERAAADHRARGLSVDEAQSLARATFGSLLRVKEMHADARGLPFVEDLWRDLRHAFRVHRRAPMFAAVVITTIGVAVGATSAIFALVHAVVFRPLPYANSGRLVAVSQLRRDSSGTPSISPPNFFDLKEQATIFEGLAAYWSPTVIVSSVGGTPNRMVATLCTPNLMQVLGVSTAMGRSFAPADGEVGAPRVAILSDSLWRGMFGADPSIVGRDILIDEGRTQIVGVLPAGVDFPSSATSLWLPLRLSRTQPPNPAIPAERYRQYRILSLVGRLKPAIALSTARADAAVIADRLARDFPEANRSTSLKVMPLQEAIAADVRPAMLLLLAAVTCLLLVAAANVATMIAVRTSARERELTVRLALGAGRGRVVRQLLVEGATLASFGAAVGLALAYAALPLLLRFVPVGIPRIDTARIDSTTVIFTIAAASIVAVAVGLVPAAQVGRRQLIDALKAEGRSTHGGGRHEIRRVLVAAEVGLSTLLLITAGLLVQTVLRLGAVELGFRSTGVFTFERLEIGGRATPDASAVFFDELLHKIRAVRGVDAAAVALGSPLDPRGRFFVDDTPFRTEPSAPVRDPDRPTARINVVSDGYFEAMGVPVLSGRSFAETDGRDSPPVVIVNRALADRYFPGVDAIGRVLVHELSIVAGQPTRRRIVGIVGDVRQFRLDDPFEPHMFVPHSQMPWPAMALVVKTSLPSDQLSTAVRSAVWSLDTRMPVPVPREMRRAFDDAIGGPRLRAWLTAVFAVAALILAAIGLYGTVAFAVQQRRGELAIRLALGATTRQTIGLVLREGLTLCFVGVASGIVAAIAIARLLSGLLFGITAADPATIAAVTILLAAVSAAACYFPARSVARIDPVRAISGE
jgi:putative ABC transport system permease protein